jgi:hypothetical protein
VSGTIDEIKRIGTIDANYSRAGRPSGQIECADGFKMSVQAGAAMYCSPRPGGFAEDDPERSYEGPYFKAEVGFPTERPEPWDEWKEFCENADHPTETVYGWVPFELIDALVALHGGEKQ